MLSRFIVGAVLFLSTTDGRLPETYQSLSAVEKQQTLYQQCATDDGQSAYPGAVDLLKFLYRDINPSFDHPFDENYYNYRVIHPRGVVFNMKFNAVPNPFTGLFQGNEYNVIRLSLAGKPTEDNYSPGIAVKFLRDNMRSANFVAMFSLGGQESSNFFQNTFRNHLDAPKPSGLKGKIFDTKFRTASEQPFMVGLSDIAQYNSSGTKIAHDQVNFPFQLILRPNENLSQTFEELTNIEVGTVLYQVWAQPEPNSEELIELGTFETTSEGVTSLYGDQVLFFQHQRVTDDLKYKSEWKKFVQGPTKESECPLAFS